MPNSLIGFLHLIQNQLGKGHSHFLLFRTVALEAHYENDNNLVVFNLEDNAGEIRSFKPHKIQILALIKAISDPLGLGL